MHHCPTTVRQPLTLTISPNAALDLSVLDLAWQGELQRAAAAALAVPDGQADSHLWQQIKALAGLDAILGPPPRPPAAAALAAPPAPLLPPGVSLPFIMVGATMSKSVGVWQCVHPPSVAHGRGPSREPFCQQSTR